jgi:electron transfer flavoprotein alpha subunit
VPTLVYVEDHEGELSKVSLGVLSRAAQLGDDVSAVLCGSGVKELAAETGRFRASKAYVADDPALEHPLPQPRVDVLASLVRERGFDTVLFGSSVLTADIAAALAVRLDAGLNWDLVDLERQDGKLVGKRPALQDSVYVDVGWKGERKIALVRAGSFEPARDDEGADAEIEEISVTIEDWSQQAVMLERAHAESEGPSIEDADVIVAGGRGLGEPKNFKLLEELAQALGGAVAATRAVVDAGWYPYATQVGQTGRTVAPKLYLACGISGAIQHKVGMQGSGTIVAINKDPNAPIFEYSDLGVVGDLHEIVPRLTQLVREHKT